MLFPFIFFKKKRNNVRNPALSSELKAQIERISIFFLRFGQFPGSSNHFFHYSKIHTMRKKILNMQPKVFLFVRTINFSLIFNLLSPLPLFSIHSFLGESRTVNKELWNKEVSSLESCSLRGQDRSETHRGLDSKVNKHNYLEEVSWFLFFLMFEIIN